MKKFLDTLKVNLNDDIEKYFRDVTIESVKKDDAQNTLNFFIVSNDIIPYSFIRDAEDSIANQLLSISLDDLHLGNVKNPVHINMRYELSDAYTPKFIFENIKNDIFKELKDEDRILATIFDTSKYEFLDDKNLKITFDDNKVPAIKDMQDKIISLLIRIFKDRFNMELNVETAYEKLAAKKKAPQYYENEIEREIDRKNNVEDNSVEVENLSITENNAEQSVNNITHKKNKSYGLNDDDIELYGKKSRTKYTPTDISSIVTEMQNIKVHGIIYQYRIVDTKNGRTIFSVYINDGTSSIAVKIWGNPEDKDKFFSHFKIGDELEVNGKSENDSWEKTFTIHPMSIVKLSHRDVLDFGTPGEDDYYNIFITDREDIEKEKRVELHLHTKMSAQDAVGDVTAYIETAHKFGMPALAITDHGAVNALPDAYEYINGKFKKKHPGEKAPKIINGVEGYLVEDFESYYYNQNNEESHKSHKFNGKFVVYEFTTTGFNKKNDSIIKIEAALIEEYKIIDTFSYFVNYKKPLSFEVKNATGIRDQDVNNAPALKEVLEKFYEFSSGACFVTFSKNSVWNLRDVFLDNGIEKDFNILDMTILSRLVLKDLKTENIKSIAKELKVKLEGVTDRKGEDKKKKLTIKENLDLGSLSFIALLQKTAKDYEIDDLENLASKLIIDDNFIKRQKYYHIILLAKNDIGRVNLYKLVSDSHVKYMYKKKPRIPRSLLNEYREGLMVGSACILGEFMNAVKEGRTDDEIKEIASYYDYLEVQPTLNNSFLLIDEPENFKSIKDLENLNKKVVEIGETLNKPVVATCDCHYVEKDDKMYRTILQFGTMFKKTNLDKDGNVKENANVSAESSHMEELYFRTTKEMLDEFSYLGIDKAYEIVVKNTNLINAMIEDISPIRPDKCPPHIEGSDDDLTNACYNNLKNLYGEDAPTSIKDRLDNELKYIIDNGYSVMYIAAKKLIDFSKENGYPVGSRGSVGSSLAATLSGVSEVNPLPPHYICPYCHHIEYNTEETNKYNNDSGFDMPDKKCPKCGMEMNKDGINIPFETFLGIPGDEKAQKEPDIDLNFCSVFQSDIHKHTVDMFGEQNTFKAGTVGTVAMKTAYGYVMKYKESHKIDISKDQVTFYRNKIVDCKNTTGQHPGGMIVVPDGEYIYTFTPIQIAADKEGNDITTHFDYHKIDKNLLKLDILGHDSPLILKKLFEYTGQDFNKVPFYEKAVLDLFKGTESLGITPSDISGTKLGCLTIPEFGTDNAMNMCIDAKPETVADLIRISGLAHGTDVWQGNVQDLIKNGDCTLKNAICCRDDIMIYLIEKGLDHGLAFNIMESVRKGKGLKENWEVEMRTHEVPEWYIGCCKKIKYMFPKAHAAAYVTAALRIAYYKIHYPVEYYAAYFSIRKDGFDYKLMMQDKEEIHFQIEKLTRLANEKKNKDKRNENEKSDEDTMSLKNIHDLLMCYRIVEEMKARGVNFTPIDIYEAKASDFRVVNGKIMPSFDSIPGIGEEAAKKCELEGLNGEYTSIEKFLDRTKLPKTKVEEMKEMGILSGIKESEENTLFDLLK